MGFFDFLEDVVDGFGFLIEEAVDEIGFAIEDALWNIEFALEEIGDTFRCVVDAIINRDNLHAVAKEVKDNKAIQNAIKYIVKEKRDHVVTFDMLDENDEIVVDGIEVDGQGVDEDVYEGQEIYI